MMVEKKILLSFQLFISRTLSTKTLRVASTQPCPLPECLCSTSLISSYYSSSQHDYQAKFYSHTNKQTNKQTSLRNVNKSQKFMSDFYCASRHSAVHRGRCPWC